MYYIIAEQFLNSITDEITFHSTNSMKKNIAYNKLLNELIGKLTITVNWLSTVARCIHYNKSLLGVFCR